MKQLSRRASLPSVGARGKAPQGCTATRHSMRVPTEGTPCPQQQDAGPQAAVLAGSTLLRPAVRRQLLFERAQTGQLAIPA